MKEITKLLLHRYVGTGLGANVRQAAEILGTTYSRARTELHEAVDAGELVVAEGTGRNRGDYYRPSVKALTSRIQDLELALALLRRNVITAAEMADQARESTTPGSIACMLRTAPQVWPGMKLAEEQIEQHLHLVAGAARMGGAS